MRVLYHSFLALILATACNQPASNELTADTENGGLTLSEGFSAIIVADELGPGRHITVRENGDVYVSLRNLQDGKGAVALRDTTGDGKADLIKYFGSVSGTGIEMHKGFLYSSADSMVVRYPFSNAEDLLPQEDYEIIAGGLVDERQHAAKPFEFDGEGNMYVTIGAPSNACMEQMRTKGSPGMDPVSDPRLCRWRLAI
ncbi:MAG: hypothetical protein U5L75_00685 [Candidatus Campbellbacteria bacterium]|nr:hypothetical protein [Candidatus Campbellbacteria bacterium]